MPALNEVEINLLKEIKESVRLLTLNISDEDKIKAILECDEYIKDGKKNVFDMSPLSVYYIISKLPEDKQITFIKENIKYIKENDDKIFLYTMMEPKSLSYFLSLNVLREIKEIDSDIFNKVISSNYSNLFHGFTHGDYYSFYTEFYSELNEVENTEFINGLYFSNRCCYEKINEIDINNIFKLQRSYNKELMDFLLEKYNDKISNFNEKELLMFIKYIEDIDVYREFVNNYQDKLKFAFDDINLYDLREYLSETDAERQKILMSKFFLDIIKKQNIKKIIYRIKSGVIIDLYNKNRDSFNELTLNDWLKVCSTIRVFDDKFRKILDTFEIDDIEVLFDTKFYRFYYVKNDILALKYVEMKYRNNIKTNGELEEIDEKTSIFSEKYLRNLSELKERLKNNVISRNDKYYKQHLFNFITFLQNENIINSIEGSNFREIEKLFFRIVMGKSLTILYEVSSIEEITIFNRLGELSFKVEEFTVEQLENYNVKEHRWLYKKNSCDKWNIKSYKELILKLIFIVGFNNAKNLLEINNTLPVLEYLVGNVDVKNVVLDKEGNPILNTKLMNLLFSDRKYSKIKEMLSNEDNDLYKYFPRMFNEWDMIAINNKDKSLKMIIDFLKSDEITLPPKYYRLEGLFKFIGCSNNIVNETLLLHDQILTRTSSTIPRIIGRKEEYSYEILRLDDMESLSIGNKTNCCFTVLGNGYSCLKHALTNSNGRIFVVKKDNEIIAHSWIWRNGDLLCFDNIEISKKIDCVDFFDIYLEVADELMKTSYEIEGDKNCLKNITIGFTDFDKKIKGIENYPCLISKTCDLEYKNFGSKLGSNRIFVDNLPQPIEYVGYSDSKKVQYLIRGNGMFNLGKNYSSYQDDRREIMYFSKDYSYDETYVKILNKKINGLRYVKAEKENMLSSYKVLDVLDLKEVYCNDDWYAISYLNGNIEIFNNSLDERTDKEINNVSFKNVKQLKKLV